MNTAVCLTAYAVSLSVLGPPLLARANRTGAAPRLGVCAWLVVMATVLAAWLAAFALLVGQVVTSAGRLPSVMAGCLAGLGLIVRGGYGDLLQVGFLALAALSALAVFVLGTRMGVALRRAHRGSTEHARAARIAADTAPGPGGAFVVDSDRRGVYCLAGRPHTIVMTRGALNALDDVELAAVLAHERAHLRGQHHRILAVTAALSAMLPRLRLFTQGATETARLLEMCADDTAARRHTPGTLVDALLALSLPGPRSAAAIPAAALSATGSGVTQRVERLLFPPKQIRPRVALALAMGAALLGPILTTASMIAPPMNCL